MSRSGYSEDPDDNWSWIKWRGIIASAIRGQRGQRFLRELIEALDATPVKALIANEIEAAGEYCALGVLGKRRGIDLKTLDSFDHSGLGAAFDIASQLAQEVMFINDEYARTPEQRWKAVRDWAESCLVPVGADHRAAQAQPPEVPHGR